MSLNPELSALAVPNGTEFPGSVQDLLALIAEYLDITGLEVFNGINFGVTQPTADNRDKPWFKTTESGSPVGWYSWNGAAWAPIPMKLPRGTTAERPLAPEEGMVFFDTTINVELIYERSAWRTAAGSPGDMKFVEKPTLDDALTANPGWAQSAAAAGRVLGAVGAGAGLTARAYNDTIGEEQHQLVIDELPSHAHDYTLPHGSDADNGDPGNLIVTANSAQNTSLDGTKQVEPVGGDQKFNVMQPTLFRWCLIKQ